MSERIFTSEQLLPHARRTVFAFFAAPDNLEAITPPWLRFRIVDRSGESVGEGTEFSYRLRIHGFPVTWRSRIEEWRPDERFVDVQLRGPYAFWHHTHEFEECDGGTLIRDRVRYRLPLGRLGDRLLGRFVESDIVRIFDYRATRTLRLLGTPRYGSPPT